MVSNSIYNTCNFAIFNEPFERLSFSTYLFLELVMGLGIGIVFVPAALFNVIFIRSRLLPTLFSNRTLYYLLQILNSAYIIVTFALLHRLFDWYIYRYVQWMISCCVFLMASFYFYKVNKHFIKG